MKKRHYSPCCNAWARVLQSGSGFRKLVCTHCLQVYEEEYTPPSQKTKCPICGSQARRSSMHNLRKFWHCENDHKFATDVRTGEFLYTFKNYRRGRPGLSSPCCGTSSIIYNKRYDDNGNIFRYRKCVSCGKKFMTEEKRDESNAEMGPPSPPQTGADNNCSQFVEHFVHWVRSGQPGRPPGSGKNRKKTRQSHASQNSSTGPFKTVGTLKIYENPRRCISCGELMRFGTSPICQDCENPRTEFEATERRGTFRVIPPELAAVSLFSEEETDETETLG